MLQMEKQAKLEDSSYKKITSHPFFSYFLLYSMSYILFGQIITCLGPMFPYLSQREHRLQTQYSTLFVARGAGFIFGSILVKIIGQKLTHHRFLGIGVSMMGFFSILFNTTDNLFIKSAYIFLGSIGCSFQDICINLAALECFKGDNVSMWLQSLHGGFAIGGLIGPVMVYVFELNALVVLGIIGLLSAIFYFVLQTPQKLVDIKKLEQQDSKILQIPKSSMYLIASTFLLAVGQQISCGGWISSYAVLYNFSTKEHATFYSLLFWISVTLSRFLMGLVRGTSTQKIRNLGVLGVGVGFVSFGLIFRVDSEVGLIFMSLLFGVTVSVMYPLLLTVPQQYGYKLTIHQTTIFVVWASIGQGCLAVGVGKMMQWFSYNWLLYSLILMNIAIQYNYNTIYILSRNHVIFMRSHESDALPQKNLQLLCAGEKMRSRIQKNQLNKLPITGKNDRQNFENSQQRLTKHAQWKGRFHLRTASASGMPRLSGQWHPD